MKHHVVVTLRTPHPGGLSIPDWQTFINDKTTVQTRFVTAVDALLREHGLEIWVTREYQPAEPDSGWSAEEIAQRLDRTYRLILRGDRSVPPGLLEQIRSVPIVEEAHRLQVRDVPLEPPRLAQAASLLGDSPADLIGLGYARAMTQGRSDVKIAVLDTGVDLDHRELRGRITGRADFVDLEGLDTTGFIGDFKGFDAIPEDEVGHGTHVAGIVSSNGERMDEGVAVGCSLMAVRVLASMRRGGTVFGAGIVDNINAAIKWSVDHGADVINMSVGIRHDGGGLPHDDVVRYALGRGVTVVAASGNDGTDNRYYPGALRGVIAVGAADPAGKVADFSSYGAPITVIGPGVGIHSSFTGGAYAVASGTSQAAPFVAGSVALMKSFARDHQAVLGNDDVIDIFRRTSDKADTRLRNRRAGYGLINMTDAFKQLAHLLS